MKRLLKVIVVVVVLLLIVVAVLYTNLDRVVKAAIEEYGPRYTGTPVSLDGVDLSPRSGEGRLEGLKVGNPEGFSAPHAFSLGAIDLALDPETLTGNPVVIRHLHLRAPAITFEDGEAGSNLQVLRDRVGAAGAGPAAPESAADGGERKFVIEQFTLSDGVVHYANPVLGDETLKLDMPDIRLTDIGRQSDGVTAARALARILAQVNRQVRAAMADSDAVRELGDQLEKGLKEREEELKGRLEGIFER